MVHYLAIYRYSQININIIKHRSTENAQVMDNITMSLVPRLTEPEDQEESDEFYSV